MIREISTWCKFSKYPQYLHSCGVTSFCPTSMTLPEEQLTSPFATINDVPDACRICPHRGSVIDESRIIINLASKEYSKCIEKYLTPKDKYITISFCEQAGNKLVTKGTYLNLIFCISLKIKDNIKFLK